ncbi:MAG: 30S ribosomal protein S2 [Verrucomicrobia bacterium]|nr:30S ribosomal protein S2 [Verrucomicrobiota bacterium]
MELTVTVKDLLDAAAHFGHRRDRWNPKMRRFILEERNGLYIIDLAKTMQQLREAVQVVRDVASSGKSILFVGTKKQAKEVVRAAAERSGEFFIDERWLGGTLTNLSTIRNSIKKMERIEKQVTGAEGLTKKELIVLTKLQVKLEKNLSGIRGMRKLPGLVVVVDPDKEHIAVAEAKKLSIPVMALTDTNCDPDLPDYVIPCNDDALKSIKLIITELTEAIVQVKAKRRAAVSAQAMKEGEESKEDE